MQLLCSPFPINSRRRPLYGLQDVLARIKSKYGYIYGPFPRRVHLKARTRRCHDGGIKPAVAGLHVSRAARLTPTVRQHKLLVSNSKMRVRSTDPAGRPDLNYWRQKAGKKVPCNFYVMGDLRACSFFQMATASPEGCLAVIFS